MLRATAGFDGLFFFFFFLHEVGSATVIFLKTFSSEPSALKRTKERFSSLANCYFVVLFTSIIVVLLDANDLSNNHHLSHDNDQSSLSHQRWFAAHIRPSNQYAGALTVDRCLLAVIILGRREDNGNYLTYWLLLELHIFVFFVKLWSRKWECATQTEKRSRRGNIKKQANKYTKETYILHPNHCVIWDKIAATERAWNARVLSFSDFQERLLRVNFKSRLSVALQYDCQSPCVTSRCAISARERSTRVQAGKCLTPHWPLTNSPFFKALNFLVRVTKLIMGASSHAT